MITIDISPSSLFNDLEKYFEDNRYISSLDPLLVDNVLVKLPQMNASKDIKGIFLILQTLIKNVKEIEQYNLHQAIAITRDIGIVLGSIRRHGIQPVKLFPVLEPILLKLSLVTNMVPRDTLLHYTIWNPEGERQRKYTTYIDEIRLVESAKIAIPRLESAIYDLSILHIIPLNSPEFVIHCRNCVDNLTGMVEAIVYNIKNVSRQIFAQELRPYFDSILVQDKEYLGPGAVEMPLFIFDHLLWSSQYSEDDYLNFQKLLLPYCHPSFRDTYHAFEKHPPLLTKINSQLENYSLADKLVIIEGVNGVIKLFKILLKFRKPHLKVVNEAYIHAKSNVRDKGSGGYQSEILHNIIQLTTNAMNNLDEKLNYALK